MKRILAVVTLALCATTMAQSRPSAAPQTNDDEVLLAQVGPSAPDALPPLPEAGPQDPGPGGPGGGPGPQMGRRGDGPRGPMKFWNNSEIATKLNLTDQQKQQLETTLTNYKLKLIDQQAAVQREQVKLEPLVQADKLDEAALTKQIDALITARGQLERTRAMMLIDMRKVLTVDQWKQLREMRHGMLGMGMGGPGGGPREFRQYRQRRLPRQGDDQTPPPPQQQPNPQQ